MKTNMTHFPFSKFDSKEHMRNPSNIYEVEATALHLPSGMILVIMDNVDSPFLRIV